jgi:co-chaperonin GroES (HSP10)
MIKDISKIIPGINRVVIKLNDFNKSIKMGDGTELYLETKYEPANHTQVIGEVAAVRDDLYFNKKDRENSMEWETTMELKKGDTVYIEYFAVMMALADKWDEAASYPQPTWLENETGLYIIVPYADIYFAIREEVIIPINGYVIARSIQVQLKSKNIILLNDGIKKSGNWAEAVYIGTPSTDFLDPAHHQSGLVLPGDVVRFKPFANQRIEYSLHKTLFKGEGEYVMIQGRWMIAKLPAHYKKEIEAGKIK